MGNNLRVVLDTNLVISAALFPASRPGQVLDYAIGQRAILLSAATFAELVEVLWRPHFDRYLRETRRRELLNDLERVAITVPITQSITACRDPKDDKFLELAVSGNATHIITGDNDLLTLHPFRNIPVLTLAAFLTQQLG